MKFWNESLNLLQNTFHPIDSFVPYDLFVTVFYACCLRDKINALKTIWSGLPLVENVH